MELDTKRIARTGQIAIFLVFGLLGIWMATAPLRGAVVVAGLVKVDTNRKTVQHNEGGIVKEILVRDGDLVAQGAPVIHLEDSQVSASYSLYRKALDAELARQARLMAEIAGDASLRFPVEITSRDRETDVAQVMLREVALFRARKSSLDEQIRLLEAQIRQVDKEVDALTGQMSAEKTAKGLAEEELSTYSSLHDKQFIANTRLLEQRRMVSEYQSRAEERRADIARALRLRDELRLKIAGLHSDYTRGATEDLKDSTARVAELRDRLSPFEDAYHRLAIRAPVSGRVLGLKVHTAGGVIGPREPLMDIVPDRGPLVIEAKAGVDAIKELHLNQEAEIRFTALPYRTTPMVKGRLVYISPDALTDDQGVPYYQLHVQPDAASMRAARLPALQPGMASEVYIQTQSRTALEYLLQPVTDSLMRAFRER